MSDYATELLRRQLQGEPETDRRVGRQAGRQEEVEEGCRRRRGGKQQNVRERGMRLFRVWGRDEDGDGQTGGSPW